MVSQISLDCSPLEKVSLDGVFCIGPKNFGSKDEEFSILSCSQEHSTPQMPVKKQTRQWAAWTRQEEESFFAALRQVGKNFEKITCRVQSKNKDQVRHYYYRLVRRMNKLLGPELCLDAKNSKDTNAAMLRWWSLLEKYSCKASKLHLKPRRFKIFVETLENQLLRDRKKSIKRRVSTGQNNSFTLSIPASTQIRAPGHESNAARTVLVDGQNIKKVGSGNGALLKRPANIGTGRVNYKIEPAAVRTSNHRRRTAAYKRWESAAIAGVSLVADAAEHLERVGTDKEIDNVQETSGPDGSQLVGEAAHSLQSPPYIMLKENCNKNSAKLKLQLFPVDECTRRVLEMDNHNPHLELTLSTKKKMSSVMEHLNRKWQNSSLQSQELVLFPFWAHGENFMGYQKWTKNSHLCAADIYYLIGSPPIFRLRYGWFSINEVESVTPQVLSSSTISEKKLSISRAMGQNAETVNASDPCNNLHVSAESISLTPSSSSTPNKTIDCGLPVSEVNTFGYHGDAVVASPARKENREVSSKGQAENVKSVVLSSGEWADSLTNVSMGDLLSESAANMDLDCLEFPMPLIPNGLHQMPFTCDSFDAAIAAHIYKHQNRADVQQGLVSHISPIWDAEETCDAFSFQKVSPLNVKNQNASMAHNLEAYNQLTPASPSASHEVEEVPELATVTSSDCPYGDLANDSSPNHPLKHSTKNVTGLTDNDCSYGALTNHSGPDHPLDQSMKDFGGLTDIYWLDSLGPLDLDVPSCRYPSTDLILTDSLSGLNRLVATSLDAFQSCSFFGLEKKESASTSEVCQTFSLSDFKIGSEV